MYAGSTCGSVVSGQTDVLEKSDAAGKDEVDEVATEAKEEDEEESPVCAAAGDCRTARLAIASNTNIVPRVFIKNSIKKIRFAQPSPATAGTFCRQTSIEVWG